MTLRTSARLYSDASLGGVLRCDSNKGVPLKGVIGAYIRILGDYIGGITDPNNRVSGPKYSNSFFGGALKPYYSGPWTLRDWFSVALGRVKPSHDTARSGG